MDVMQTVPAVLPEVAPPGEQAEIDLGSPANRRLGLVLLIAFASCTTLTHLTGGPALGDHECINAQSARQVIQSGHWLIPYVGEIPRVRKTPLGIWLIAGASRLFDDPAAPAPVSEFAARLPSALAGFGITFVLFWLGRMMYGYAGGLMAGFVWAASAGAIIFGRVPRGDIILAFFTTLAFACFWRGAVHRPTSTWLMAAFYVAFALAMMAKAPLPLAIVGVGLALYWLLTIPLLQRAGGSPPGIGRWFRKVAEGSWAQFKRIPALWILPGTAVFLVLAGAWPLYAAMRVGNVLELWKMEYVDLFTGDATEQSQPALYYIPIAFALLVPYALSFPEALGAAFLPRYRAQRRGLAFALTWAVWGTFFLSLSAAKRPHYLLSVVPAYCLLLAPVIERLYFGVLHATPRQIRALCTALPCIIAAAVIVGAVVLHRLFPALLWSYLASSMLVLVLWASASWSYARGGRLLSFALLNLGSVVVLALGWPIAGMHFQVNEGSDALAEALHQHGVTPQDEVIRVDGRPDSSIEYYHGYRVQRLINELEMARLRPSRREMPVELYARYAAGIEEKLQQSRPVYLILSARNYDLLKKNTKVPSRVLWHSPGFGKRPGDEPLVITQARPPATAPE